MLVFPVCSWIEKCRSANDIRNIVYIYIYKYIYIYIAFVGLDNKLYKMHSTYIKILKPSNYAHNTIVLYQIMYHTMKTSGRLEVYVHTFLISALDGGVWSASCTCHFPILTHSMVQSPS